MAGEREREEREREKREREERLRRQFELERGEASPVRSWRFILAINLALLLLSIQLVAFGRQIGYVFIALVVISLILIGYWIPWTGFGEVPLPRTDGREIQPRKLLWDWLLLLSALAVPIVIAVAGFWFTTNQNARQQDLED